TARRARRARLERPALTPLELGLGHADGEVGVEDGLARRVVDTGVGLGRNLRAVTGLLELDHGAPLVIGGDRLPGLGCEFTYHGDQDGRRTSIGAHFIECGVDFGANLAQPLRGRRHRQVFAFRASMSLGTTFDASPTTPRSETPKIGASGSLLMAMMLSEPFMPTMCCVAPEMPIAM